MEVYLETVKSYKPREYTTVITDHGIILCDKNEGAFLVLRFKEDIERLRDLLNSIVIKN